MSHLNNPNTRRLATDCCVCGTALCDAKSVEMGIGPTCRKKTGFLAVYSAMSSRQQKAVNKLIHEAGRMCEDGDITGIFTIAEKVEKKGFPMVAIRIRDRFVKIRIHRASVPEYGWTRQRGEFSLNRNHDVVQVWVPYSQTFNANRRDNRLRGRPCKVVTEHGKFHWEFKVSDGVLLMRVLALTFPGMGFLSDSGTAVVPTPEQFNDTFAGCEIPPIPVRR